MFENLYTTKMSTDKKKLENRFSKIVHKSGMISKIIAIVIFLLILALIVVISANLNSRDYKMTDEEFLKYLDRPIGSMMADLDYVDDYKLIFHYLEGFFVIDRPTNTITHKINLHNMNVAYHTQGDTVLEVKISKDGKYAYLSSIGMNKEKYYEYIIDTDSGQVQKGKMPEGTELFTNYSDTLKTVKEPFGWYTDNCIKDENITFYLTAKEPFIGSINYVIIHHKDNDNTGVGYVFGRDYVTPRKKQENLINESLKKGEEILINSGSEKTIDGDILKDVLEEIDEKKIKADNHRNYTVVVYEIWHDDNSNPRIFIIDDEYNLILNKDITMETYFKVVPILFPVDSESELYKKTEAYLEKEFHRVYDQYYDIQNLSIHNWKADGNTATFLYKKQYLTHNRNPDIVPYIIEAKEKNQETYEKLYRDYLALKESNYHFKVVDNGEKLELYYNQAPKGEDWQPIKIDDFILNADS